MVVLVDAKYFGLLLRQARQQNGINTHDAAQMLGVPRRRLVHYEHGTEVISESVLATLFYNGVCLMRCKKVSSSKLKLKIE